MILYYTYNVLLIFINIMMLKNIMIYEYATVIVIKNNYVTNISFSLSLSLSLLKYVRDIYDWFWQYSEINIQKKYICMWNYIYMLYCVSFHIRNVRFWSFGGSSSDIQYIWSLISPKEYFMHLNKCKYKTE